MRVSIKMFVGAQLSDCTLEPQATTTTGIEYYSSEYMHLACCCGAGKFLFA